MDESDGLTEPDDREAAMADLPGRQERGGGATGIFLRFQTPCACGPRLRAAWMRRGWNLWTGRHPSARRIPEEICCSRVELRRRERIRPRKTPTGGIVPLSH